MLDQGSVYMAFRAWEVYSTQMEEQGTKGSELEDGPHGTLV